MGRKGKKKGASFSDSLNLSSKHESKDIHEESLSKSFQCNEIPYQFSVSFDENHTHSKWLKTKNVVLLHPSIIKSFHAPEYFWIKGNHSHSLCVAYPLKSVTSSNIVFPKESMGFQHQELVTLHSYTKPMFKAGEIVVSFNSEMAIDEDLKEQVIMRLMNKKFFCCGMVVKLNYIASSYQFTIVKISCTETDTICDIDSFNVSGFKNNSISLCDGTDMSLNDTNSPKLLSCGIDESFQCNKNEQSSTQLDSMFSSMCLDDNETLAPNNSFCDNSCKPDQELHSEMDIPTFFSLCYASSITILGNSCELETTSLPTFSQIGGLKEEMQFIKDFLYRFLNSENIAHEIALGVLMITGPSGTGKTLTLTAIRDEYDIHIEEIQWYKLYLMSPSEADQELHQVFQRAIDRSPSIILIDNFNYLCPIEKDPLSRKISSRLSNSIERCAGNKIVVVAAANDFNCDYEVLQTSKTVMEEVKFRMPTSEEREDILTILLATRQHNLSLEEVKQCVMYCQGFTGKELLDILNDALTVRYMRQHKHVSSIGDSDEIVITFSDIKETLKYKKPSIMDDSMKIKKVKWSDIGGMQDVKGKLKDIVEGPLKYADSYKRFNITPSQGVLLYGPPGCSKTMIAKALATECDLNFISKNVSDINNKYVGESEKAVRDLFVLARAKAPCIIFLDEIDALVPGRGSSSGSGVEDRIVNTFLQEMDGVEELSNVFIIAATNRPDRLDEAFVRNGRIDHFLYIPLPDIEAREEILKIQMKNRSVDDGFDYNYLAHKTEGYSGAEIVNVCNEAAFQVLSEDNGFVFTLRHFENAMKSRKPGITKKMIDFYENFHTKHS